MKRIAIQMSDLTNLLNNKKGFILDFDGTIANTEKYHWISYSKCLKEIGISFNSNDISKYIGKKEIDIYKLIKLDYDVDFNDLEFFNKRIRMFFDLVKLENLQPFNYLQVLFDSFADARFYILSSQKIDVIEKILKFWGLEEKFAEIYSASDMKIEKKVFYSDPLKYFGLGHQSLVVFEDTEKYLIEAKMANIFTVGIASEFNNLDSDSCDVILETVYD